jgi:sortase A
VWLIPNTSLPNLGGNTVLSAHRFVYGIGKNAPFINLNMLNPKDNIYVYWKGKEYVYEVEEKIEVESNENWIMEGGSINTLTLFTCTPLFNPVRRLVIISKLVSIR